MGPSARPRTRARWRPSCWPRRARRWRRPSRTGSPHAARSPHPSREMYASVGARETERSRGARALWWVSLHRVGDSFFEHSFLNLDILNHRVWLAARVSNPVLVMMREYLIIHRTERGAARVDEDPRRRRCPALHAPAARPGAASRRPLASPRGPGTRRWSSSTAPSSPPMPRRRRVR